MNGGTEVVYGHTHLPRLIRWPCVAERAHGEVIFSPMESDSQSLTREQQAAKLLSEGLAADRDELLMRLDHIGFYRLNGYTHTFREKGDNGETLPRFRPGTTLRDVWDCYRFDRNLRLLFLDAIERIEVSLRSQLAYLHTQQNGAYAYADAQYFPKWKGYVDIWKRVRFDSREVNRSEALRNFYEKDGGEHQYPPLGIAISCIELGPLVYFFDYSDKLAVRKHIVRAWGIESTYISSWMHALNYLRNDCAHHVRVWNKQFFKLPQIPKYSTDRRWYCEYSETEQAWTLPASRHRSQPCVSSHSPACFMFVCRHLMQRIAPTSSWHHRMAALLHAYGANGGDLDLMGLPKHWETHPLWTGAAVYSMR